MGVTSVPKELFNGDPAHFPFAGTTTPGVEQTLIDITVPADIQRDIHQIIVACHFESTFKVTLDGTVIGSGRTSAGHPTDTFLWFPPRPANAGQEIKVLFTSRDRSPPVPVEAYLMCADVSG